MPNKKIQYLLIFAYAFILVFIIFLVQGNMGFNLWDEGFLWYGVQRLMAGDVPVRDYMAYDPGRYYWSAGIMNLIGSNGIMSLRLSVAVFQFLGLFVGLMLIARGMNKNKDYPAYLFLSGLILIIWMFPRHKLFDISLSIFLIGVLTFIVEAQTFKRYFIAGCCIGLIAAFGRNHGLYGAFGGTMAILWLSIRDSSIMEVFKKFILWGAGIFVGFTPIIAMVLFIPGFAPAYLESILVPFEQGVTDLPLPIPWPWTVNFSVLSLSDSIRGVIIGIFFVAVLIMGPVLIGWMVFQRFKGRPVSSLLVASALMSIPYAQYALSRADVSHLAQGIFPLLIGCIVLFAGQIDWVRWSLSGALCIGSFWVMYVLQPAWSCMIGHTCVPVDVLGNQMEVDPGTAGDIALLHQFVNEYASNGQSFLVTPFWPGAYPLFERRSPMWDIYAVWPRSRSFEEKEIERITESHPAFVLVLTQSLDGRDELRFMNTHPLIYQYILDNFVPVHIPPDSKYQLYTEMGK